jgi:hypothetical protein
MELKMPDKRTTMEMERAILAGVKKQMALPRITKSAREALFAICTSKLKAESRT